MMKIFLTLLLSLIIVSEKCYSQLAGDITASSSYYMDVNASDKNSIFDVRGDFLHLKYKEPVNNAIAADIVVKPMYLQCGNPSNGNLVEFYGMIDGGKAPYQLSWYVLNKERTDFLYQPRQAALKRPGYTSSIDVDKT